jgi:CHAD domain-containing protein
MVKKTVWYVLLEHLGHRRFRSARRLYETSLQRRRISVKSLKRCSSIIQRNFQRNKGRSQWSAAAAASALNLSGELAAWPKLNRDNLHPFRLKLKQLRYVLQLSGQEGELVEKLGEAKDKIGEWHDWTELTLIAEDVLNHSGRCDVIEQIRAGANRRFNEAVSVANRLRRQYFSPTSNRKGPHHFKQPVWEAASKLAA